VFRSLVVEFGWFFKKPYIFEGEFKKTRRVIPSGKYRDYIMKVIDDVMAVCDLDFRLAQYVGRVVNRKRFGVRIYTKDELGFKNDRKFDVKRPVGEWKPENDDGLDSFG